MDNYSKVNQDIIQTNYQLNMMRNPEATFSNTIRIGDELNAQGTIPIIYTYRENGNINHRSYSLNREQLKKFIQEHPDTLVTLDGINPIDMSNNRRGVGLEELGKVNIMEPCYSTPNLYADFQPMNSFQTSFHQKYNTPTETIVTNSTSVMDLSKISGNDVNFPSNKVSN